MKLSLWWGVRSESAMIMSPSVVLISARTLLFSFPLQPAMTSTAISGNNIRNEVLIFLIVYEGQRYIFAPRVKYGRNTQAGQADGHLWIRAVSYTHLTLP